MQNTSEKIKKDIKYRVEDLVTIGDAIHDSYASFIIVANKEKLGVDPSITTAIHGHHAEVVDVLARVLEENDLLRNLMFEALTKMTINLSLKLDD